MTAVTADPSVVAVVLSYDGRALLETILPSLAAQTYPNLRTLVIDNGSSDDSLVYLAREWPDVEVLALPKNIGVAAALNRGMAAARGDLIALLNNDIELEPGCLAELVETMRAHPDAAVACPKLVNYYRRDHLDGTGDVYRWGGEAGRRAHGERDTGQYDRAQDVFSACGGAALYRTAALADVGAYDESFFAYYEDVDWSFRAQLAGWRCRYAPSAVAYHIGGATLGGELSDFLLYHNWRNQIWVMAKNWPLAALIVHSPQVLFVQGRNLLIALRSGRVGLWLGVWRAALAGLPGVLRKRRGVQRSRRISVRELHRRVALGR
ncbi:MAG TPA: glycosyltransferase family 2 protein [Solirubrobacteraceae bacterium]|jgi:hypothetical protein|nr:glycosyltransferase family 2 protein [Solirubrobacteraceae bacterium]